MKRGLVASGVALIYPGARPPVYKLVNGKLVATYPVTQTLPAL